MPWTEISRLQYRNRQQLILSLSSHRRRHLPPRPPTAPVPPNAVADDLLHPLEQRVSDATGP
jgi:hypothetical protein